MPHLDANALESDPEGMAFLRGVMGDRQPARSWPVRTPKTLPELLVQAKSRSAADTKVLARAQMPPLVNL